MAELYGKIDGTCKGTGGSMHIYDVETHFQGGWALVAEQLPYAVCAARSIMLDRQRDPEKFKDDDRISIVFIGEGGAQNGRMAECLNAAAKEPSNPLLGHRQRTQGRTRYPPGAHVPLPGSLPGRSGARAR